MSHFWADKDHDFLRIILVLELGCQINFGAWDGFEPLIACDPDKVNDANK